MFKKLYANASLSAILVLSSFFALAQQQIASIPLKGELVGFAQCAFSGDTTLVSFSEQRSERIVYRTLLVFKDGSYKAIRDSRLIEKIFIEIDNANDSLYVYFLEEKRKTISITYVVNADSAETSNVAYKLPKQEIVLGTFNRPGERGFNVVTASPTTRQMTVLHVHGSSITLERQIDLPVPFFEQKLTSFAFIPEGHIPSPKEAEAKTKVYWNSDQVVITEDILPNHMTKTIGKTTMVSIDLNTGKKQSRLILEPTVTDFSTYVHNNTLYKISEGRKKFTIDVYDSLNKKIHSMDLIKKMSYGNELSYHRNERSLRVSQDKTVRHVIAESGHGFISVHPLNSNTLLLKVGTHRVLDNPASIPMHVVFGTIGTMLINAVANAANYQLYPEEHLDKYFYLTGTPESFNYVKSPNFVHERIDAFEKYSKENEFSFKSYAQNKNEVIAIYVPRNISELRIVRFVK